ncbi:MAG: DUF1385 domain-containing protein [Bacteriovoracaceae bacterium]|nr:DUF1385 domain-containing protein [Bacteriovoracaceae bacterium]
MKFILRKVINILMKEYTSIGGQAVVEGVMMRSPNAFVVAVRTPEGKIRLRKDQWFGFSKRIAFFRKPFLRGVIVLIESMANGIVALNYSASIAMEEERKQEALKKGKSLESFNEQEDVRKKKEEKVNLGTFFTILFSFALGMGLFIFLPHALTIGLSKLLGTSWDLDSSIFHAVDGVIKAFIFILYIYLIGLIPDVRLVFQYHGAEHKSIATFEAGQALTIENARRFSTLHPRCGTTFIFFLLFISIIIFSVIFAFVPIGKDYPFILKHLSAVLFKISLMLPIAGISYEIIRFAGRKTNVFCKTLSFPGMMLQKLTTKEPTDAQLEVALASIKTVLFLEEKFNLKDVHKKVLSLEEIDVANLAEIEGASGQLKDFLE